MDVLEEPRLVETTYCPYCARKITRTFSKNKKERLFGNEVTCDRCKQVFVASCASVHDKDNKPNVIVREVRQKKTDTYQTTLDFAEVS